MGIVALLGAAVGSSATAATKTTKRVTKTTKRGVARTTKRVVATSTAAATTAPANVAPTTAAPTTAAPTTVVAAKPVCTATSMDALVAAAKREGTVTFYNAPSGVDAPTATAFRQAYGIQVNAVRLNSIDLIQRFSAEADSGVNAADVWFSADDGFVENGVKKGWFHPSLKDVGIPGFPGEYPANKVAGPKALLQARPFGMAFNTDLYKFATPPKTWLEVLEPKYKGNIILADPKSSDAYVELWDAVALRYGDDFLTKLQAQKPSVFAAGAPAVQALAAGEGLIEIPATGGLVANIVRTGAPIAMVTPVTTYASQFTVAVPTKAPHPNAACLLTSWLMSRAGQKVISDAASVPSVVYEPEKLPADMLKSKWAESADPARKRAILAAFGS